MNRETHPCSQREGERERDLNALKGRQLLQEINKVLQRDRQTDRLTDRNSKKEEEVLVHGVGGR